MAADADLRPTFEQILEELGAMEEELPHEEGEEGEKDAAPGAASGGPAASEGAGTPIKRHASFEPNEPAIAEDE